MFGAIAGIASKVIGGVLGGGGGGGGLLGGVLGNLLGGKKKAKEAKPEEVRGAAKEATPDIANVLKKIADALEKLLGMQEAKKGAPQQIQANHSANKYFKA